jgi:hypothetical protein
MTKTTSTPNKIKSKPKKTKQGSGQHSKVNHGRKLKIGQG